MLAVLTPKQAGRYARRFVPIRLDTKNRRRYRIALLLVENRFRFETASLGTAR